MQNHEPDVVNQYQDVLALIEEVAYPAYVDALIENNYTGYLNWEFCHPARQDGQPVGIEYVHAHTYMAREYMQSLRAEATARRQAASFA
jgi:hypothetical protein